MSIKLDWETDAQTGVVQHAGEDPETQNRRRAARLRFSLIVLGIVLIGALIVTGLLARLRQVDSIIERQLQVTVDAEIAAIRIGDSNAYLSIQWQALDNPTLTADWITRQMAKFDTYQALKLSNDVNLTGRILSTTIDGQNGRVQVEEIIDGIPYGRVEFYWRFQEGWRHVPPAYSFWGESATITENHFTIMAREVDAAVAAAVATEFNRWYESICATLTCDNLPHLTIDITPDSLPTIHWSELDTWRLQIPSPYLQRARLDQPFDPSLRLSTAAVLVERLTATIDTAARTDADFLKTSFGDYLIEQFAQVDTAAHLITSLAENYGIDSVRRLLNVISPTATIAALSLVTNEPLDEMRLDWRDFLTFRLESELTYIRESAESSYYALYNMNDPLTATAAANRLAAGDNGTRPNVVSALVERDETGTIRLRAIVVDANDETAPARETIFMLVEGIWKRAN